MPPWPKDHLLTNRDYKTMTGDCPTHGPGVPMTTRRQCKLNRDEKIAARADVPTLKYKGVEGTTFISRNQAHEMRKGKTCEICGDDVKLVIDHCHETGYLRGVLCNRCNILLGAAKDDVAILAKAIQYLEEFALLVE